MPGTGQFKPVKERAARQAGLGRGDHQTADSATVAARRSADVSAHQGRRDVLHRVGFHFHAEIARPQPRPGALPRHARPRARAPPPRRSRSARPAPPSSSRRCTPARPALHRRARSRTNAARSRHRRRTRNRSREARGGTAAAMSPRSIAVLAVAIGPTTSTIP